jgi:hypothetical protein
MDTNPEMEVTSDADVEAMLEAQFAKSEQRESEAEPEAEEEPKAEEVDTDQPEAKEEPEAEEEAEEIEIEGEQFSVPKKLKNAFLRQEDYTKKTQEVAEQRRQLEEQSKFIQVQAQIQQAQFEKAVEVKGLANQVAEYEKLDWQALTQQDPAQAMALNMQYQQLQKQLQAKAQEMHGIGQQAQQLTAQQRQTLAAEGAKAVKTKLPNWGPELQSAIAENTKSYGFNDSELSEIYDPRLIEVLHDAMQWKKLQAAKPATMKKASAAKPLVKTSARSFKQSQESSQAKDMQARYRKTGRPEDVENFLAARFAQKRK